MMRKVFIWIIRVYQKGISPYHKPCCRFYPTCSNYAIEAIAKYGAWKGGWMAVKRICRCNPFNRNYDPYDPVP